MIIINLPLTQKNNIIHNGNFIPTHVPDVKRASSKQDFALFSLMSVEGLRWKISPLSLRDEMWVGSEFHIALGAKY